MSSPKTVKLTSLKVLLNAWSPFRMLKPVLHQWFKVTLAWLWIRYFNITILRIHICISRLTFKINKGSKTVVNHWLDCVIKMMEMQLCIKINIMCYLQGMKKINTSFSTVATIIIKESMANYTAQILRGIGRKAQQ